MESSSINEDGTSNNNINENQKIKQSQEENFESLNPQGYAKKEYWNERF
jgi:hypothetical protein